MFKLFIIDFDTSSPHCEDNVEVLFIFGSGSATLISGTLNKLFCNKKEFSRVSQMYILVPLLPGKTKVYWALRRTCHSQYGRHTVLPRQSSSDTFLFCFQLVFDTTGYLVVCRRNYLQLVCNSYDRLKCQ